MPTQYETNFTIRNRESLSGTELLQAVTDLIVVELQGDAGESDYNLETYQSGNVGYAQISAERPHPRTEASVRLEARLCTRDDDNFVGAQILTRFISPDGNEPPDQPAGPPRLLHAITRQFQCESGTSRINEAVTRVTSENAGEFAREQILNPERTLPIFLITENSRGATAFAPDEAQRALNGVAQVAHCDLQAAGILISQTRISTYNSAARIYWPECQVGKNGRPPSGFRDFYMPDDARKMSLYDIQKTCLANQAETDFDILFSSARTAVILERNRQLEVEHQQHATQPAPDRSAATAELKRAKRVAEVHYNETNRKLQAALETIKIMEQERDTVEETASRLEREVAELTKGFGEGTDNEREERRKLRQANDELREKAAEMEKTIARLNAENQSLKQRGRNRDTSSGGIVIRLGNKHPCNVTVLNHALNIYRDPYRKFIVRQLQAKHGNDLTQVLSKSVEFKHDQRSNAANNPESAFDVGDFSEIINANRDCFSDNQQLTRKMREIAGIRNQAAHPPAGGISEASTLDGLETIAGVLQWLNEDKSNAETGEIWELINTMQLV